MELSKCFRGREKGKKRERGRRNRHTFRTVRFPDPGERGKERKGMRTHLSPGK